MNVELTSSTSWKILLEGKKEVTKAMQSREIWSLSRILAPLYHISRSLSLLAFNKETYLDIGEKIQERTIQLLGQVREWTLIFHRAFSAQMSLESKPQNENNKWICKMKNIFEIVQPRTGTRKLYYPTTGNRI